MLAAALALLLAGYAVAQDSTWTPSGKELPASELAALHSFRAHIEQHRGLLSTWSNDTHPCSWEGVLCECSDVYPRRHQDCPDEADPEFEHVFGLDFGPRKPSNKWLTGTLSPLLGDLSEARILYFHSNELRCGCALLLLGTRGQPQREAAWQSRSRWEIPYYFSLCPLRCPGWSGEQSLRSPHRFLFLFVRIHNTDVGRIPQC